jgi:protein-S-isoprenylcysteine O-methyltransferase Ste14
LGIIGLAVRIISILELKQYYFYAVTKVENLELVETGMYKYIRHQGYLG